MSRGGEASDLTNQTIAGYSILHRLGVGGMSEVYLAFQQSLHRHVALKVLRADFVGSDEHEQRFLQEARAAASLMHPNIVQVYDVGKFESIHYIAQEYVPGSNLSSFIQRRGALPLEESVSILWQATAALQKAASIGLVHRDIKPDNLLLTPDGEVKVADFGLARARGQSQNLTAVGVTLGTPLYMSPEQIQGLAVDSRSDMYSLGATAYHMLAGRPPFAGETALALAMQHLQAEAPRLEQLRPDLPMELVEIVHRLLRKSPEDRFGSASELSQALRQLIDTHLEGRGDKMIPFSGMVIEHQAVSTSSATQELQWLQRQTEGNPRRLASRWRERLLKALLLILPLFLSASMTFAAWRIDLFANQRTATAGVVRETSIQRQYGKALLENNLKYWNAVSEYFPPTDAVSRSYHLKAELQIARLWIEGEDLAGAERCLRTVIDSPYADDVLRTLARIELGWLNARGKRALPLNEYYDRAMRDFSIMIPEKQRLIRDALPAKIRTEWDNIDYLFKEANQVEDPANRQGSPTDTNAPPAASSSNSSQSGA